MNPRIPESLMAVLRRVYPPEEPLEDRIIRTPQLDEVLRNALPELEPKWDRLRAEVRKQWPGWGMWNITYLVLDPSFRLRLTAPSLPADIPQDPRIHWLTLVLMVSIIAPYHHLYIALERKEMRNGREKFGPSTLLQVRDEWPPSVRDDAWVLEEKTRAVMGTTQLPLDLLETKVPYGELTSQQRNERTLGEYLFGTDWF